MQGKTINGFTLQRLLGVGGMAEVWYAESEIGMKAAVKILSEELSHNAQMKERFLNEAKVMVQLDHPNIRKVHGYGSIDGRSAIIMEYLDGSDLKTRMKQGQHFTNEELKRWWNQMVDALNYTHIMDIVHRDIKPSNIFIDQKGNAKLLDFGIAKVADTTSGTLTGSTLGTRIYMSPEQVKDPKRVGTPSDSYSLAVSFVHLLTGKAPYDSTTSSDYDIQVSIVTKSVDLRKVPAEWQGFLKPFLDKDANRRPALKHFEAVVPPRSGDDDDGTIDDEKPVFPKPPHSGPAPLSPTPTDKPTNKKGLWIGLGIAAAVIVALLLLLRPKPAPTPIDPDTQAYEACQTVADYRAYISDYGRNSMHYSDAKAFVERYVTDSMEQSRQAQALADAAQKEESERQAQAKAEKKEDDAYRKCTTIAACESYLRTYPQGRYLTEVRAKKAELEEQAQAEADAKAKREAEQKEDAAYGKCTTIAACESYLKSYPQGRYVAEVRAKKTNLEAQAAQSSVTGSANGHEWVDLGLPSGTLWATCNIGASKPEGYGSYFAWGETKPQSSNTYNWNTYKYANGTTSDDPKLTKYCSQSKYGDNGFTDDLTTLQSGDDPATASWGSGWRMPSKSQWDELLSNTVNQWTKKNGVAGRLFTSKKNGQSVFLPAAGDRWVSELYLAGSVGFYWSGSLNAGHPGYAWYLRFNSDYCNMYGSGRSYGFSVRPVRQN